LVNFYQARALLEARLCAIIVPIWPISSQAWRKFEEVRTGRFPVPRSRDVHLNIEKRLIALWVTPAGIAYRPFAQRQVATDVRLYPNSAINQLLIHHRFADILVDSRSAWILSCRASLICRWLSR
jgi:hypothetical protein